MGVDSSISEILLIVTVPNHAMGYKLINKLADSKNLKHPFMCVYMKCGHNINWEISNKHKNLQISSFQ